MSDGICVGVALKREPERAQVTAWLEAAGNRVISMVEACHVDLDVAGRGFGCVLADAEILTSSFLAALHRQDSRLQIVAVVDDGEARRPELHHRCVRAISRPVEQSAVTLAVSLAYGEGRHLRRSVRWRAPRLPARAGDVPAHIIDVSADGLRLELSRGHGARLTPQFRLRVPMLALDIVARRVWVGGGTGERVQCGALLVSPSATQKLAWERGLDLVKSTGSLATNERGAEATSAEAEDGRLFNRVSKRLASKTPLVRDLVDRLLSGRL